MAGTSTGDMLPSTTIATEGVAAQALPDGWMAATFSTAVLTPETDKYLVIVAAGGTYRNGAIKQG